MKNNGGSAFPSDSNLHPGMSLRDWFAGVALLTLNGAGYDDIAGLAIDAYTLADAMLREREQ